MIKVLFVCLGNICRSPTADGVLRKKIQAAGLADQVEVDSAGTSNWHIGKAPDARSQQAAAKRGYDLSLLRARQVAPSDFTEFDYVLAMDYDNLSDLKAIKPAQARTEPQLFLKTFGSDEYSSEVPDPYYGGDQGFEKVLDMLEDACTNLLADIRQKL